VEKGGHARWVLSIKILQYNDRVTLLLETSLRRVLRIRLGLMKPLMSLWDYKSVSEDWFAQKHYLNSQISSTKEKLEKSKKREADLKKDLASVTKKLDQANSDLNVARSEHASAVILSPKNALKH
jgi:hypothetical protein